MFRPSHPSLRPGSVGWLIPVFTEPATTFRTPAGLRRSKKTGAGRWPRGACYGLLTPWPLAPLFDIAAQVGGRDTCRVTTAVDEAVLAGGTLAYGIALQRVLPERWHVAANAVAVFASLAFSRRAGASAGDCGLARGAIVRGMRAGSAAAAGVTAAVVLASLSRRMRPLFAQDRVSRHRTGRAAYEVLVRIPVGTALSEELLFRGSLLGVMLRRHPAADAIARASLLFGAWHILPTVASLRSAAIGREMRDRVGARGAIAGSLAVTTAAGAGLAALRMRSGSVAAPAIAHAALNASAYMVARRAGRSSARGMRRDTLRR